MADLRERYQDTARDHRKQPRNFREPPVAHARGGARGEAGDRVPGVTMTVTDLPPTPLREDAGRFVTIGNAPTSELVRSLSRSRDEPDWMLRHRLRALERLRSDGVPAWAAFLLDVDL